MRNANVPTRWLIPLCLAAVLALSVVLMACGSDEPTAAPATERATSTPRAGDTPTAAPATGRATSTPRAGDTPTAVPATERATSTPRAGDTPTATPTIAFGPTSVETDREALIALYNATDGENWEKNENWLSDESLGQWWGVSTDNNGRVTHLYITHNRLSGEIPPELGSLSNLKDLVLDDNELSGEIPPELGGLSNLTRLALGRNRLSGEIPPELGGLSNLISLSLGDNELRGEMPPELGDLFNLLSLSLGRNRLTGEIPPWLGNLSNLRWLWLGDNELRGEIPPWLGNLSNLQSLYLDGNELSGEIPPWLGGLSNLTRLALGRNRLSGEIPPELGNLLYLESLHLGDNELSGKIPPELGGRSYLEWLVLDDNELSGEIPPELGNLSYLRRLSLSRNRLSGEIPSELGGLFNLRELHLDGNELSGKIPPELGGLSNLGELSLGGNRLSGEIPPELGDLSNLRELSLGDNELSGEIPPELGNLFSLRTLWLDGNDLSGCVPRTLGGQYVQRSDQVGRLPFCTAQPAPTKHPPSSGGQGNRLQAVRDRGILICAGRNDVPGFSYPDSSGNNVGFDIDLCRAVAAAVLGDPNAIEIRVITAVERGPIIRSGEVDMIVRTVTWTTSRDAYWGNYAHTMFYDGQGFMVNKSMGISSALELQGATVCVTRDPTERNLRDFSNRNNLNITPLTFEDTDDAVAAYESGQCDALTKDHSKLAALGMAFADRDAHLILPETISEEPLGPLVPHGDEQWSDVVRTVMGMLIYAEAYGVSSANVPFTVTGDTKVDRLLGTAGHFGQEWLGLRRTAAQDVIRAVGNYGEIYERHLTPLGLVRERSRNALWLNAPCSGCPKGGQIYAPPLR